MSNEQEELESKIAAFWRRKELQYPELTDPFRPGKIHRNLCITACRIMGGHRA
jgi:hypothetical protein